MIILNRFRDSEEDITDYERFILTKEDCKNLIQNCLDCYEQMKYYNNLADWFNENKDNTIQEIIDYIKIELNNKQLLETDYAYFGNSYEFTYNILQYEDKIIDIDDEQNFSY